ncbi:hypothetical protein [Nocardioides sp.]|uniref:hypothetical protein n=1 Tax=Nocardioides sp. TaxID=35761 RepID=UPI00261DC58F|nr:hypothetical protein [Nocardioides sp.]MCW2736787.1 hypothetical protein [Nocardioides sp.]
MTNTPLEDRVHEALHRRADPIQHSPFTVTDVRRCARRIQRRRAVAAGAVVAAVLAIAVPVGLAMNGPTPRTDVPPATRTPQVTGPVRIDPRAAEVGAAPGVPLVVTGESSRLLLDGKEHALPGGWDQITPYGDGWLATRPADDQGNRVLEILTDTFTVEDGAVDSTYFTVSADGTRVAWAEYDGVGEWRIVNSDTAREAEPVSSALAGTRDASVRTVGFLSSSEVVVAQTDLADGTEATYVATGDTNLELTGIVKAVSASPATGLVAALTSVDGADSCSAVVDGRDSTEPAWETCDHRLGDFSPDGTHLVGFADVPDGPSPTMSVLDSTTGESIVDFEVTGARDRVVGVAAAVWEDDQFLLATYVDGNQQYVVRLGLDGTVERVSGPVVNDDFTLSLHLTPGAVR